MFAHKILGEVMDIQNRNIDPFEQHCINEFSMCHDDGDFERDSDGFYDSVETERLWRIWELFEEAKSQVPEGFVLVPREPTEEMLGAAWEAPPAGGPSGNRRVFYEKQTVVYKAMVDEAEKEMTEAQEQSNE